MKNFLPALFLSAAVACAAVSADDTVKESQTLTFQAPSLGVNVPTQFTCAGNGPIFTTQQDTPPFDLSDFFQQLQKQGTLTVNIDQSTLTPLDQDGSTSSTQAFQALKHAQLTIDGQLLAETDFTLVNGVVNLPITMPINTLTNLLAQGPQTIHIVLQTCVPSVSGNVSANYTIQVSVNFSTTKGV